MTGYTNGYNAYKKASVTTASQGKLVVMLYEAAVRELEYARDLIDDSGKIEPSQIENFGNSLQKVEDIIMELQVSLDMENGGEIAKNLMALYVYFNKELTDATIKHDKKKISFILDMMKELHSSWVTAANSNANAEKNYSADRPALNIIG